jgi:SAM-dependent methyltransferase
MSAGPSYELVGCPVCESRHSEEIADSDSIRRELEILWEFQTRRLSPRVPVMHLLDRVVFSQDPPLRLARCSDCGTVYRNPREDAEGVVDAYATEHPDLAAMRDLFRVQRRDYRAQARRLTRAAGRPGTGLEVGSYVGGFLSAAADQGWAFEGVDVNAGSVEFARRQGLRATLGRLEEMTIDRSYSAVAIWNCFDQLPDPRDTVRRARRLLVPGGLLVLRVPNGAFYCRWRRRSERSGGYLARAVLAHNNLMGFPYRHGFTPASLSKLLRRSGFEPVRVFGDTLVTTSGRWTRRWAAWEERTVKAALRATRAPPMRMPWFEVYARAV